VAGRPEANHAGSVRPFDERVSFADLTETWDSHSQG
jgi:hypothetical protein